MDNLQSSLLGWNLCKKYYKPKIIIVSWFWTAIKIHLLWNFIYFMCIIFHYLHRYMGKNHSPMLSTLHHYLFAPLLNNVIISYEQALQLFIHDGSNRRNELLSLDKKLKLRDVVSICQKKSNTPNPIISVDCNWVANFLGRTQDDYVWKTVDRLAIFSILGFHVYPIIDEDIRHHSKMVSVGKRSLQREIANLNVMKNRSMALTITAMINDTVDTKKRRTWIPAIFLEKSLISSERLIPNPFPTSFYNDIIHALSTTTLMSPNDVGGRVCFPVKARF